MDPLTMWLTIAGIGSGVAGSALSANASSNALQLSDAQFEKKRQDDRMKALADFMNQTQTQDFQKSGAALQGTQLDPYVQAKSLNGLNVRKSFAAGLGSDGKFNGNVDFSAISPDNLQKNADLFYSQMGMLNPDVPVGSMSKVAGDAQAKQLARQNQIRKMIQDYLNSVGQNGPAFPGGGYGDGTSPAGVTPGGAQSPFGFGNYGFAGDPTNPSGRNSNGRDPYGNEPGGYF